MANIQPRPDQGVLADSGKSYALPHCTHQKYGKFLKVPVEVVVNDSRMCETVFRRYYWVIARSAKEALDYMWEKLRVLPETEITAYGPKGGKQYRFVGWETAIGYRIIDNVDEDKVQEMVREFLLELDPIPQPDELLG